MNPVQGKVTRSDPAWSTILAAVLLAIPLVFFALDSGTHFAWGDEVQFVDPAASAYFGQGFTSMAWPYQSSAEFFAGNAPGYSLLLVPWFSAWGFGLEEARWFNVPVGAIAGLLIWLALRRAAPGMPAWLKAAAICVSCLGVGFLVSSGSARYDVLCLLVASWIFLLLSRGPAASRWPLVLAGAATFYAGFHFVAALVIVMLLLLAQGGRKYLAPAAAQVAGVVLGLASWLAVLAFHGLFVKFFIMLFGSQHTISGQMAKLVLQGDKGVLDKLGAFRSLVTLDPSLSVIAVLLAVLLVTQWRRRNGVRPSLGSNPADRLIGWLAIDFAFVLPVALLVLGKFPIYYTWIAYVPAVLIAAVWSWRCFERGTHWPVMAFVVFAACAAAWGVHDRIARRDAPPGSAAYPAFNTWVRDALTAQDLVYADHEAYFAARAVAGRVLAPTYAQTTLVRGIPERERVTALLLQPAHQAQVVALVGGEWREQARHVQPTGLPPTGKLDYILLRRAKPAP